VESVMADIGARGSTPSLHTFNALIAAAARLGDYETANDAAARLEAAGLPRDTCTYEGLVRAAATGGHPDLAWEYYEQAVEEGGDVEVTMPIFNALVIASGRAGQLRRTFDAVDEMRRHGHEPDEVTWRELLSSCARHGDAQLSWKTYKQSRKAGHPPNEVALNIIIGVTLLKIRELTDPDNLPPTAAATTEGAKGAVAVEPEWKEWADRAIAVYHEATVAGVRPRIGTFSAMLACLRPPTLPALQAVDREAGGTRASTLAHAVSHEVDSHEDARMYYPLKALIMYEEAQALGVVPKFFMKGDSVYDVRAFPPAAAEVAVLTLLRVFRRYSDSHAGEGDVDLPTVTLRVLSDDEHEALVSNSDANQHDQRLARTGDRVVVLLRRLRFNYGGSLEAGAIELSGNVIKRWLKAKPPPPESLPGMEPRLAGALQDQARNIRSRSFTDDDGEEGGASSSWSNGGRFGGSSTGGRSGGGAGGGRASAGPGRGLGSGSSSIDFFGASDPRYSYSADSGDDDDDNNARSGYEYSPRKWVSTGWVPDDEDDHDDGMMGELSRIINQ
jgi:pentatricopeptide repeat protein